MRQEKQTFFGTLPWFPEVNSDRRIWNCASIHHDLLMVFSQTQNMKLETNSLENDVRDRTEQHKQKYEQHSS